MLARLQTYFADHLAPGADADADHAINLAAAALLIEIARADSEVDADEAATVDALLADTLALDPGEIAELVDLARAEIEGGASLFQFTHRINREYSIGDKRRLMEQLWRVAWADGRLDRYEEQLLRRLAELLHLRHSEFMRAKHAVIGD